MYALVGLPRSSFSCTRDLGVGSAERSRVAVNEVDAAVVDPDVVENSLQFLGRNSLPDDAIDFIGQPCGFLDAQTGAGSEMQANLTGIHLGEEIPAEKNPRGRPRASRTVEKTSAKEFRPIQSCL